MKIIAANWKMNNAFDETDQWLDGFFDHYSKNYDNLKNNQIILCPPAILLDYIDSELMEDSMQALEKIIESSHKKFEDFSSEELNNILIENRPFKLGGQDCHHQVSGSFTGDISAATLAKVGCEYVIVGHSERRVKYRETDQIVAKKALAALQQKLTPIICIGESKEVRDQNQHIEFVTQQFINAIDQNAKFDKLIIAYEPIWAIGTGVTPNNEQLAEVAKALQQVFVQKFANQAKEFHLLYGGSVSSKNSGEILAIPNISGLLVGKASLDIEQFIEICLSCQK